MNQIKGCTAKIGSIKGQSRIVRGYGGKKKNVLRLVEPLSCEMETEVIREARERKVLKIP